MYLCGRQMRKRGVGIVMFGLYVGVSEHSGRVSECVGFNVPLDT